MSQAANIRSANQSTAVKVPAVKSLAKSSSKKTPSKAPLKTLADDNVSLSSQTDLVRPNIHQDLACYKCGKKFKREQHSDLIDHLDECN